MKRNTILVADDVEMNRMILFQIFGTEYEIMQAKNGEEVLSQLEKYHDNIAVILLDVIMPKMNGLEVLKKLASKGETKNIPVIFVTSNSDDKKMLKEAYKLGVTEVISKPIEPTITKTRIENVVKLYNQKYNLALQKKRLSDLAQQQAKKLIEQSAQLNRTNEKIIETLATIVETRAGDSDSGKHIKNVKKFTKILLEHINKHQKKDMWTEEQIQNIAKASVLHDVGKILVKESILLKPGRFTEEERKIMEEHAILGCSVISSLKDIGDDSFYQYAYDICRYHHEKWDGNGYPDKLQGEEIPIHAHIFSITDAYEALTHPRIYRGGTLKARFTHEQALYMIHNNECGVFAPWLLEALDEVSPLFKKQLQKEYPMQLQ